MYWNNDIGWICPKCGRVFSPYTSQCEFCNASINTPPAGSINATVTYTPNQGKPPHYIYGWWSEPNTDDNSERLEDEP